MIGSTIGSSSSSLISQVCLRNSRSANHPINLHQMLRLFTPPEPSNRFWKAKFFMLTARISTEYPADIDVMWCSSSISAGWAFSVCRKLCIPWHSFSLCPTMIRLYEEFENQPHRPSIAQNWSYSDLFVCWPFPAMTGSLPASIRFRIVRLLLLHWQFPVIVEEVHCCSRTMYSIRENIFMYSSSFKSQFRLKEIFCKMFKTAENNLIVYLENQSWVMQKEMIWYIWEKWDINVHQFMISRILKRKDWNIKKEQHVEVRQNDELRLNWIADMFRLTTEQLVFMNEFLFNEITDWHHQIYAFVDQSARYQVFKMRKHCWSVLLIYMKNEYQLCINIRKNWFNDKTFFWWLADELLSLCSSFSISRSVIIMNNANVHCNSRIKELIISHECQISCLSHWIEWRSIIDINVRCDICFFTYWIIIS